MSLKCIAVGSDWNFVEFYSFSLHQVTTLSFLAEKIKLITFMWKIRECFDLGESGVSFYSISCHWQSWYAWSCIHFEANLFPSKVSENKSKPFRNKFEDFFFK